MHREDEREFYVEPFKMILAAQGGDQNTTVRGGVVTISRLALADENQQRATKGVLSTDSV